MIITPKKVLELNDQYHLITNLSEREKNQPEGVGFDLRIGEIFRIKGSGYLGAENRKTPDSIKVAEFTERRKFTLKPGEFVLVSTIEEVNLPSEKIRVTKSAKPTHLAITIYPRTTLQ